MKMYKFAISLIMTAVAVGAFAQESTNTGVRRRAIDDTPTTQIVASRTDAAPDYDASLSEGDVQWMRVIYRELDLDRGANAALYFPEEVVDGKENLFRIIMRELASGSLPAYEYLDGKEIFTDQYRIDAAEMLDRFDIPYAQAKTRNAGTPVYEILEGDVPCTEVLSYYIIERNTFDNRQNRLRTVVEAICPVLHRAGDFGGEALKYPMFWIKYSDLQPRLSNTAIFIDDSNNVPAYSYADFFRLGKYQGEIYKTRNLRNKSMAQLYPDPDDMKRAQDSIQAGIDTFEDKLWVPDREEIIGAASADADESKPAPAQKPRAVSRSGKKPAKVKAAKGSNAPARSATRSVRRRK